MNMKRHINNIVSLIKENNFDSAMDYLNEIEKSEKGLSNYLKGILYLDKNNPNKSEEKAKNSFIKSCESEDAIENSFVKLSNLVSYKQKNYAKNILRSGIKKFPSSVNIYEALANKLNGEELEVFLKEAKRRKITSIGLDLNEVKYRLDNKQYTEAIKLIERIVKVWQEPLAKIKLKNILGFAYYECSKITKAKELFEELVIEDIGNRLDFIHYYGQMLCLIEEDDTEEALRILKKIRDYSHTFPPYCLEITYKDKTFYFDFDNYILKAINCLEKFTNDRKVLGIIKGIRGTYYSEFKDTKKIISDLKYAVKVFPNNRIFTEKISEVLESKERYFEAYNYLISYIQYNQYDKTNDIKNIKFNFFNQCNNEIINNIADDITTKLKVRLLILEETIANNLICPLIEVLFKSKEFFRISEIADQFNKDFFKSPDVIFNIAYSYNENKNIDKAEIFYKKHLEIDKDNNASLNNLGFIYREKGTWKEALALFEKGITIYPYDEYLQKNLKEIRELLKQINDFENENIFIKNKLIAFYNNKDENGYIVCPYRLLPKFFNTGEIKANSLLKDFLKKGYIIKITEHNLDTQSSVYKINPFLEENIDNYKKQILKEEKFLKIAQKINSDNISSLGFSRHLMKRIKKITDKDLYKILKRDIDENILAFLTESYKSSLVLSGSIIETLLLYKLLEKGIEKYKLPKNKKNKQIKRMSLYELLEVAEIEKLISSNTYHVSHFIRNYRDLIHPGVEHRKKAIQVNERNAKRAIDFLIDALNEILE